MAQEHSEAVEPLTIGHDTRYWLRVRTMGAEAELKLLDALRSAWTEEASWGLDKVACTHVVDVIRSWGHYYVGVWVLPSCNRASVAPAEYWVTQMNLSGRARPGKPDIPQHPALPPLTEPICRAFFKVRAYAPSAAAPAAASRVSSPKPTLAQRLDFAAAPGRLHMPHGRRRHALASTLCPLHAARCC